MDVSNEGSFILIIYYNIQRFREPCAHNDIKILSHDSCCIVISGCGHTFRKPLWHLEIKKKKCSRYTKHDNPVFNVCSLSEKCTIIILFVICNRHYKINCTQHFYLYTYIYIICIISTSRHPRRYLYGTCTYTKRR